MGPAPMRFRFESCSVVGPLLCEPIHKHWCLLLPTGSVASLFDTEIDNGVKEFKIQAT
jgi:hypothetical protein